MEGVLLLFDESHPCWTHDLVQDMGEDPGTLKTLQKEGLLMEENGIYSLTKTGLEAYRQAAGECFYDVPPGETHGDPGRAVARTRLELLLDRTIWGRWGIKEFRPGAKLPYVPPLSGKALFDLTKSRPRWTYGENPGVKELVEKYPMAASPGVTPPDLSAFETWLSEKRISYDYLELDLLFLHHYDSEHFRNLPPQPNDTLGLYHTDRFYFQLAPAGEPDLMTIMEEMGKFHLFLMAQRRIFLPWFFNRDSTDYDAVNWWFWVTKTDGELAALKETISPIGDFLVRPALPMELWGISMETLRQVKTKREYHWDLFEEIAIPLSKRL